MVWLQIYFSLESMLTCYNEVKEIVRANFMTLLVDWNYIINIKRPTRIFI